MIYEITTLETIANKLWAVKTFNNHPVFSIASVSDSTIEIFFDDSIHNFALPKDSKIFCDSETNQTTLVCLGKSYQISLMYAANNGLPFIYIPFVLKNFLIEKFLGNLDHVI